MNAVVTSGFPSKSPSIADSITVTRIIAPSMADRWHTLLCMVYSNISRHFCPCFDNTAVHVQKPAYKGSQTFILTKSCHGMLQQLVQLNPHLISLWLIFKHYGDVIMGATASQIISLTVFYSTVYSDADQRKHQSSASLAFVWRIHRGPVNSPHKWPVTRKMFPFDDVIMEYSIVDLLLEYVISHNAIQGCMKYLINMEQALLYLT